MKWAARIVGGRFHYGWLAVAVVFLVLLAAAGTRATPSVMMVPLEHDFGWSPRDDLARDFGEYRALWVDGPVCRRGDAAFRRASDRPYRDQRDGGRRRLVVADDGAVADGPSYGA